jgi:tetratricopeptide (TPR) repeat protein
MKRMLTATVAVLIGVLTLSGRQLDAADGGSRAETKARTSLSPPDQKRYDDALFLIHTSNAPGDHLENAFKILTDLAQRNPQSGYPYAGLADLKYVLAARGDGSIQEAFTLAQRAIKLDPNVPDAYVVVAKVMIEQDNIVAARQAADRAIALAPDKPEAMFAKARVAERSDQYNEAEQWYLKTIDRFTDNRRKSNIYSWLGQMFENKKPPDIPKAEKAYEKSIELDDQSPWKLNQAGTFLIAFTDRYDQAIDFFNRVLAIEELPGVRSNLGLAQFYKWGHAYLNPGKYKNTKQKPDSPKTITKNTGLKPEYAFVKNPLGPRTPWATIAMLKTGMIKDVDVVLPGSGGTALVSAAFGNHLDVVKMLVAKGANVNAEDTENKSTAIFYAVANQNLQMVTFLVGKGARINQVDGYRRPLVTRALDNSTVGDVRVLRYLLSKGADPTVPDQNGNSLIANAIMKGHVVAVRLLIEEYHADPNAKIGGESPILAIAAVLSGTQSKDIVKILLRAGANPWVKYGPRDVLFAFENMPVDEKMFPSFKDNLDMILAARRSVPRPADFGRAYPEREQ